MSVLNPTTSTTRPSNPSDGELFFETDTRKMLLWDGSAWREYDNTSGATSGSGTDSGSGSGSGTGGSGSGDGSGSGSGSGSGDGGTTPGAGTNTDTGITDAVAQPGSNHSNADPLGDDTSTGDVYSFAPSVGVPGMTTSDSTLEAQTNGRFSMNNFEDFNNKIMSFWVRFDDEYENLATDTSNLPKYLWSVAPRPGATMDRGLDFSSGAIQYQGHTGKIQIYLGNTGMYGPSTMLFHQHNTHSSEKPPYNPYVAHNADGGETRTGQREPITLEYQVADRHFHKDRWYHIAFNWHRSAPDDWENTDTEQFIDLWIDGVKQSTATAKTMQYAYDRFLNNPTYAGNFILGGGYHNMGGFINTADTATFSREDTAFPGLIQRFSQYKYTCPNPGDRLFDDDMKALYALGAEATNPMFKTNLPENATLLCFDTLLGDENTFPGQGNAIPIKMWERKGTSTDDNNTIEGTTRAKFYPSDSRKSFAYAQATYNKPYSIGFGNWKSQEYSDGILKTGYKTNMSNGGSVMLWVNISDVDKNGVQYLFGSKNSPSAEDRDGANPDQFAIGVEQALGSTACRFKLYYMQEDGTAPVYEVHNNEWHCIAMVVDPSNSKASFYYNGEISKQFTGISSTYSGNQLPPFYIGDANGANSKMEGLMSRVHYYSGVWTEDEVSDFYQAGPGHTTQAHTDKSTLDYALDGRMVNIGGAKTLYPNLTYTGTGKPKYARSKPY